METRPNAVLRFWFQECRPHQWFRRNAGFDAMVLERFGKLTSSALNGELSHWEQSSSSALALVLMMDHVEGNCAVVVNTDLICLDPHQFTPGHEDFSAEAANPCLISFTLWR